MIQLNLLPDVKDKYLKTERLKRLVFGASLIAAATAIVVVGFLASFVYGAQGAKLKSLDKSITDNSKKISDIKDLDKILTIQNQLNSLPALHDKKVVSSRLFDYLVQVTPSDVSISNINVKFSEEENAIVVTGSSKSLETTNKFVDTLKFTQYTVNNNPDDKKPAFNTVVLSSFAKGDKDSTYTITAKYDPALFSQQSKDLLLLVPKQVTTQSTTQRPAPLFKQLEEQAK